VTWLDARAVARSALAPRTRLLPGLGARLNGHPAVAAVLLHILRMTPGARFRAGVYSNVTRPLCERMDCELIVRVSGGSRLRVTTSDVVGRLLATSGVWEPHVTAAFRELLRHGDICVDAGAHIGYFTLIASRLVGPSGHVYALEPESETYEKLCANLELNAVRNVSSLCVGAGSRSGRDLLFPSPPGNTGSAAFGHRWGDATGDATVPQSVPVRPLSSIVPVSEWSRIRLVKIDVEGYELEALKGLAILFDNGHRPSLIVEVHGSVAGDVGAWFADLRSRHALFVYRLRPEVGTNRSVPAQVPVAPLSDSDLRALHANFIELLVSPVRLLDRGGRE
jgi:FkbM family methyltransferase